MIDLNFLNKKLQHILSCALRIPWVLYFAITVLQYGFFTVSNAQTGYARQPTIKKCAAGVNMSPSSYNSPVPSVPNRDAFQDISWLCYYGADRSVLSLQNYTLLILEADALGPINQEEKSQHVCIAYMSIGEVVQSRWFWTYVQDKEWIIEENSDWLEAHRIDPRSNEWADILIDKVAPALLASGYDGFFLDNVDIGEYLENKDPVLFEGASQAVAKIIRRLHQSYPNAVIITNGGLATAAEVADCLSAVVNESTFSSWQSNEDGTFFYAEISAQSKAWLRPRLFRIQGAGLPVLALEYVDPYDIKEQHRVREAVKKAGHYPYIAERSLMHFPGSSSLPLKD